mmetsp:Transcript_5975/g.15614  ORF Transcript_5975/g.15614 Transcript_5975/m.15614 type:complete len:451 (+) Transcript_5975:290-1642(+)
MRLHHRRCVAHRAAACACLDEARARVALVDDALALVHAPGVQLLPPRFEHGHVLPHDDALVHLLLLDDDLDRPQDEPLEPAREHPLLQVPRVQQQRDARAVAALSSPHVDIAHADLQVLDGDVGAVGLEREQHDRLDGALLANEHRLLERAKVEEPVVRPEAARLDACVHARRERDGERDRAVVALGLLGRRGFTPADGDRLGAGKLRRRGGHLEIDDEALQPEPPARVDLRRAVKHIVLGRLGGLAKDECHLLEVAHVGGVAAMRHALDHRQKEAGARRGARRRVLHLHAHRLLRVEWPVDGRRRVAFALKDARERHVLFDLHRRREHGRAVEAKLEGLPVVPVLVVGELLYPAGQRERRRADERLQALSQLAAAARLEHDVRGEVREHRTNQLQKGRDAPDEILRLKQRPERADERRRELPQIGRQPLLHVGDHAQQWRRESRLLLAA